MLWWLDLLFCTCANVTSSIDLMVKDYQDVFF